MKVGCYSLDMYCDREGHDPYRQDPVTNEYDPSPWTFTGRTEAACIRDAKATGWKFHSNGSHTCPRCAAHPTTKGEGDDAT